MKVDICLSKHEFKVVQEDEMKGRWWKFDQEARVERRRGGYIKRRSKGKQTYRSFHESFSSESSNKERRSRTKRSLSRRNAARRLSSLLSRAPTHAAGTTPPAWQLQLRLAYPRLAASLRPHARTRPAVWRALPRGSSKTQVNKLLLLFSILRLLTRSVGRSHSSVDRISGRNKRADIGRDSFPPLIPMLISPEKKGFFAYFPAKRIYLLNELSYKVAVMPML